MKPTIFFILFCTFFSLSIQAEDEAAVPAEADDPSERRLIVMPQQKKKILRNAAASSAMVSTHQMPQVITAPNFGFNYYQPYGNIPYSPYSYGLGGPQGLFGGAAPLANYGAHTTFATSQNGLGGASGLFGGPLNGLGGAPSGLGSLGNFGGIPAGFGGSIPGQFGGYASIPGLSRQIRNPTRTRFNYGGLNSFGSLPMMPMEFTTGLTPNYLSNLPRKEEGDHEEV